ncbi:MAG: hypothetical protein FJ077_04020 [Cyanobacteria bacterium K_DeepCast_35m_m2_023]|nr:hypothetical protein [Cyanobacteria bacterium K_DeepCast_35m_m2_023]
MTTDSDTVLGSLCRETCRLRSRAAQLLQDLERCHNPGLVQRLHHELDGLRRRRQELQRLSLSLLRSPALGDSLTMALLDELCHRPLVWS